MDLQTITSLMLSSDYKDRMKGEYYHLLNRKENLEAVLKLWDNGKLTFKDLRNLSAILGEDTLNIKTEGGVSLQVVVGSQEAAEGLKKAIETGAQPAKPTTETED